MLAQFSVFHPEDVHDDHILVSSQGGVEELGLDAVVHKDQVPICRDPQHVCAPRFRQPFFKVAFEDLPPARDEGVVSDVVLRAGINVFVHRVEPMLREEFSVEGEDDFLIQLLRGLEVWRLSRLLDLPTSDEGARAWIYSR